VVSLEDVIEELVGEIQDEHDEDEEQDIVHLDDGSWLALGKANIHEVGDEIGLELPDELAYDTLAGFVTAQVGRMPQRGDSVVSGRFAFTVRAADDKRVTRVQINPLSDDELAELEEQPKAAAS
jgi:CBS domain containing-hemolysin-like protein